MKDMLGQEVVAGDYFAYPLVSGRSANMAIYEFKEVTADDKVKARPVERTYGGYKERLHPDFKVPFDHLNWTYNPITRTGEYSEMTQSEIAKVRLKAYGS